MERGEGEGGGNGRGEGKGPLMVGWHPMFQILENTLDVKRPTTLLSGVC